MHNKVVKYYNMDCLNIILSNPDSYYEHIAHGAWELLLRSLSANAYDWHLAILGFLNIKVCFADMSCCICYSERKRLHWNCHRNLFVSPSWCQQLKSCDEVLQPNSEKYVFEAGLEFSMHYGRGNRCLIDTLLKYRSSS